MRRRRKITAWFLAVAALAVMAAVCRFFPTDRAPNAALTYESVPLFSGMPYVVINDNIPEFKENEIVSRSYEFYSELDALNRCGYAMACIGIDLMPTEDRGNIGQIKPTGWQTIKYDFVDGKYLYNRCHLIGFQLTGENANPGNLITGTRYLNVEGMLPFENMVADYIKETENHVMYRVTPVFVGDELVARGVKMEAWSVEDQGAGICFSVYAYNNQPGVSIDYTTGDSMPMEETVAQPEESVSVHGEYILNTASMKFHLPSCEQGQGAKDENKKHYSGSRAELIDQGYIPAGCCKP